MPSLGKNIAIGQPKGPSARIAEAKYVGTLGTFGAKQNSTVNSKFDSSNGMGNSDGNRKLQAAMMPKVTNKDSFSTDVLSESKLVLVDFWAEWCGPCKQIAPRLEEIAEKYSEKLSVCKVDVDENRDLAVEYNVRSIPSLMVFKDGAQVDGLVGAVSIEELEDLVTRNF